MPFNKEIISIKVKVLLIADRGDKKSNLLFVMLKLNINSKQQNPRQLWNIIKELSSHSSTSVHASLKDDEGDMIKNPLTVANLFNEHVCNVCKSIELNTKAIY